MDIRKVAAVVVFACFITCGCKKSAPESYYEESILSGEWQIDRAVLESNMYTGTSMDGDFENTIFDPEDYVGYILRYSEESFSLGAVEYVNPSYLVTEITGG